MTSKEALNILSSYIETEMGSDEYYKVKEAYDTIERDLIRLEIIIETLDKIAKKINLKYKDINELEYIILKDLEELEELKKIMGTPIQDIMKRLKILEIIKKAFKSNSIYLINFKIKC